jgi:hypothetical protein
MKKKKQKKMIFNSYPIQNQPTSTDVKDRKQDYYSNPGSYSESEYFADFLKFKFFSLTDSYPIQSDKIGFVFVFRI